MSRDNAIEKVNAVMRDGIVRADGRNSELCEYMLAVIRDPLADWKRRDDMAKAAAPYCHGKMSDKKPVGKKERPEQEVAMAAIGTEWDDLLR